jgi:pyrimidine dimer DNA glycosylase
MRWRASGPGSRVRRVQTFLPYPDFVRCAQVLDGPRLGKQRVETLQILRALELPGYGWVNHPAVAMWRGRTPALVAYGLAFVREWRGRGNADSTEHQITEFAPHVVGLTQVQLAGDGLLPTWLGDERVHRSHRSALLRKDPAFYRPRFGDDDPDDLPYFWPDPDVTTLHEPEHGRTLWMLRPENVGVLGRFLTDGVGGVGAGSGIEGDLTGLDRAGVREAVKPKRPGKRFQELESWLFEVTPGDEVGVLVDRERAVLVGTVTGEYEHATEHPVHRRTVRWAGRIERADLGRPALLQNPRELFRITV